jgi:hypothetical protein
VAENELNLVNNLANQIVVNAVEDGLMQHPDMPQDSSSSAVRLWLSSELKELLSLWNFPSLHLG